VHPLWGGWKSFSLLGGDREYTRLLAIPVSASAEVISVALCRSDLPCLWIQIGPVASCLADQSLTRVILLTAHSFINNVSCRLRASMPPRRSVGRNATATPARSTRGSSAVPVKSSGARRATRAGTQQPGARDEIVNNPHLTEVQTQHSYAYGSKGLSTTPDQLAVNDRMSMGKLADTIDAGVKEAKGHFEGHVEQTNGNIEGSPPASRTRRKSSREPSQEPSRELSVIPEKAQVDKEARVAAWADSLRNGEIEDIPEEDSEESEVPDDATRKDTEPSSFPSGIFDHSYNFERGTRRPRLRTAENGHGPSTLQRLRQRSKDTASAIRDRFVEFLTTLADLTVRTLRAVSKAILEIPESTVFGVGVKLMIGAVMLGALSVLFCSIYSRLVCDPESTSILSQNLQKLCGTCTASVPALNLPQANEQDVSRVSASLKNINKQLQLLESRLSQRFDSRQAALESRVDSLRHQQIELSSHLANLQLQQSPVSGEGVASPLLPRVNFFAPSNGAVVNTKKSTPTKQKAVWLPKRVLMRVLQIRRTVSKDPSTALEPWHDVGDCWCAASNPTGTDYVRLHITINEDIYPTEMVVEHFPQAGTREPGSAPRSLELWADSSGVKKEQQERSQSPAMTENNVLGPGFAKIGVMEYDTSAGVNHVQAFKLDVNQRGLRFHAKHFTVRVMSTWGADHACLYRVRLHGVPLDAPASPGLMAEEYYERQGYETESA
jgi:Sad1 / UNC-like C-terminal